MQFPIIPLAPFVFSLFPESYALGLQTAHLITATLGVFVGLMFTVIFLAMMVFIDGQEDKKWFARFALGGFAIVVTFALFGAYMLPLLALILLALLFKAFQYAFRKQA